MGQASDVNNQIGMLLICSDSLALTATKEFTQDYFVTSFIRLFFVIIGTKRYLFNTG